MTFLQISRSLCGYGLFLVLLSFGQQALKAETPTEADKKAIVGNPRVQELLDSYKQREAKIRSLEVQWEENVVQRMPDGLNSQYVRKWRVLLEGNKVRTEETGDNADTRGKIASFITVFDGAVGKRMSGGEFIPYALGSIDSKDGSEMLAVNNANLDCMLFALLPSVVLKSRDHFRSPWTEQIGELNGERAIVLSRRAGKQQALEEKLYIDAASLLIKRAMSTSPSTVMQWDVEYREVNGQAMPAAWKWSHSYLDGQLEMARTSQAVKVTLNPKIAPAEFDMEFPVGTRVRDARIGKSYIVGPGGKKLSNEQADRIDAQIKAAKEAADKKIESLLGKPLVLAGKTSDGKPFSTDQYKGKVVLVHFWASFCMPCLAELPHIHEAYKKYHDQGLEVLGVSYGTEAEVLTKSIAENKIPWMQILDQPDARTKETMMEKFAIRDARDMLLIDRQGVCRSIRGLDELEKLAPKLFEAAR